MTTTVDTRQWRAAWRRRVGPVVLDRALGSSLSDSTASAQNAPDDEAEINSNWTTADKENA